MVFSSVPVYLDPPNWNQQFQGNVQGPSVTSGIEGHQLPPPALAAAPQPDSGTPGSVRPGSMADRARMAKMPQPEPGLKCPRCESANTKFCYFNNYSLTQPRHFCKTCRRYWTRGGALRNVPVGGGCRRNKRRKSSSKSASSAPANRQDGTSSTSSTATGGGGGGGSTVPTSLLAPQSQFPFMASSLHGLSDYAGPSNLGLGFPGIQSLEPVDYQLGISGTGSGMGLEHWRLPHIQQFPFLGRVEPSSAPAAQPVPGLYQFEEASGDGVFSGVGLPKATSMALITQMASVKMEDSARSQQGANSSREFLGMSSNEQYWGGAGTGVGAANSGRGSGAGWATDLAGFNSTSSGNIL